MQHLLCRRHTCSHTLIIAHALHGCVQVSCFLSNNNYVCFANVFFFHIHFFCRCSWCSTNAWRLQRNAESSLERTAQKTNVKSLAAANRAQVKVNIASLSCSFRHSKLCSCSSNGNTADNLCCQQQHTQLHIVALLLCLIYALTVTSNFALLDSYAAFAACCIIYTHKWQLILAAAELIDLPRLSFCIKDKLQLWQSQLCVLALLFRPQLCALFHATHATKKASKACQL